MEKLTALLGVEAKRQRRHLATTAEASDQLRSLSCDPFVSFSFSPQISHSIPRFSLLLVPVVVGANVEWADQFFIAWEDLPSVRPGKGCCIFDFFFSC